MLNELVDDNYFLVNIKIFLLIDTGYEVGIIDNLLTGFKETVCSQDILLNKNTVCKYYTDRCKEIVILLIGKTRC